MDSPFVDGWVKMNNTVVIVDDDNNIAELMDLYLKKEGYSTVICSSGKEILKYMKTSSPLLILLDIMMPEIDGFTVLKEIRKSSKVPVIMVTAKGETFDKVLGLELGADDYMVKPFDPEEFIARVRAVIRRYADNSEGIQIVNVPNLKIDKDDYVVIYHENKIEFPPKELELLYYLASHPNRVYTREQLLDHIWGYEYIGETRTVDVHIKRIREKFTEDDCWEIKTVWGVGYKFQIDEC